MQRQMLLKVRREDGTEERRRKTEKEDQAEDAEEIQEPAAEMETLLDTVAQRCEDVNSNISEHVAAVPDGRNRRMGRNGRSVFRGTGLYRTGINLFTDMRPRSGGNIAAGL